MQTRKWRKWWKDRDFIILTSKAEVNEKEFWEWARETGQRLFGTPNPSLFHKFFKPIEGDKYARKDRRRKSNT